MAGSRANLGQRAPASKRMADKGVPAMMDGQCSKPCKSKRLTGSQESPS
jgi:hypothetical protein